MWQMSGEDSRPTVLRLTVNHSGSTTIGRAALATKLDGTGIETPPSVHSLFSASERPLASIAVAPPQWTEPNSFENSKPSFVVAGVSSVATDRRRSTSPLAGR